VDIRSGSAQLQLALHQPAARPPPTTLSTVIGHGEFRHLLRQIIRDDPSASSAAVLPIPPVVASSDGVRRAPSSVSSSVLEGADDPAFAALKAEYVDGLGGSPPGAAWSSSSRRARRASRRKPDGTWRICYDYRGLNAISRPAVTVEPLPHMDALLDRTRGSRYFTWPAVITS
jgi:hypothetical protein